MLDCHGLILNEQSKEKPDTKRSTVYDFLKVGCTLQTSRINNEWEKGTFYEGLSWLGLEGAVNLTPNGRHTQKWQYRETRNRPPGLRTSSVWT